MSNEEQNGFFAKPVLAVRASPLLEVQSLNNKKMKRFIQWLSLKNWAYKLAVKLIANRIVHGQNRLTRDYLMLKGWDLEDGKYWVEPNIKDRDKIWIEFENHYYRVWHGKERTFITLESSLEWFENYYLLAHGDNGRYKLAGVGS
jgi:hypothetical protein